MMTKIKKTTPSLFILSAKTLSQVKEREVDQVKQIDRIVSFTILSFRFRDKNMKKRGQEHFLKSIQTNKISISRANLILMR